MVEKKVTVRLYHGEDYITFEDVEVTSFNQHSITFTRREEHGDEAKITDWTSTLPYTITETMTGPKSLL